MTVKFISLLMLENVDMMSSLGDDLPIYVLTALPFIVMLSVPFRKLPGVHLPKFSYVTAIGDEVFSTRDGHVRRLKRSDELVDKVKKYYRISLND